MDKLGIDPKLLISQIVNFLLLYFLLSKLLYKPILKLLEDRKKAVEKTLENLNKSRDELEKTEENRKKIFAIANAKADEIIAQSQKTSREVGKEILDNAKVQAQKVMAETKINSDQVVDNVSKIVQKRTGKMVLDITSKMISDLDKNTQHQIIEAMLKKLE